MSQFSVEGRVNRKPMNVTCALYGLKEFGKVCLFRHRTWSLKNSLRELESGEFENLP